MNTNSNMNQQNQTNSAMSNNVQQGMSNKMCIRDRQVYK